jgi:hypothetical protein
VAIDAFAALLRDLTAPAVGLLGVYLGARLVGRAQDSHWKTEVRLRTYLDVVRSAREFLWRGDEVGRGTRSMLEEQREAVRTAMLAFRDAVTAVSFVAPADLRATCSELLEYYSDVLYDHFRDRVRPPELGDPVVQRGRDLLVEFQRVARANLGIASPS